MGQKYRLADALLLFDLSFLKPEKQQEKGQQFISTLYDIILHEQQDLTFTSSDEGDMRVLKQYVQGDVTLKKNARFRSTRIRTFYNSLVTVPNAGLITANVDNMGSRRFRRHKFYLNIGSVYIPIRARIIITCILTPSVPPR